MDFFLHPAQAGRPAFAQTLRAAVELPGLGALLIGLAASVPFMNSSLYQGSIARALHGADIAYYVGIVVAGVLYYVFRLMAGRYAQVSADARP